MPSRFRRLRLLMISATLAAWVIQAGPGTSVATVSPELEPPDDTIRAAMIELEPFVVDLGGRPSGFYAEIWQVVAAELGVDVEVIWFDRFPELLTALDTDQADVVVAPLTPTAEREPDYDFTSSVIASGPQLGYHERIASSTTIFSALVATSVRRILLAALLGLVILAHLIWLVERNRADEEGNDFRSDYLRGIWDGFWWATVTVTTVGYGDKAPRSFRGRTIALLAMLLSLFLVGAFVSQVTDILQEHRNEPPVGGLDDVGSRPVGVVEGSSFADYVTAQGVVVRSYPNQDDLFLAAEEGAIDLVVTNPYALDTIGAKYGVQPVGEVFYTEFEAFALRQGSPWREPVNQVLADLQTSGEIEDIIERWRSTSG